MSSSHSKLTYRSLFVLFAVSGLFGALALFKVARRASADTTTAVSISSFGTAVTQDFNSLVSSGTGTLAANTPAGWGFSESGTSANNVYTAGTGSGNTGDTYSFGSAAAPSDRALGQLRSGSLVSILGGTFINNTGGTITSLNIAYTGEQWRLGATGRSIAERMDFQYSTNATSLTAGTWTDANALDFVPPVTAGTVGAIDGNTNHVLLSSSISGLSIPAGATFWIRWTDVDATGADDGLAIDDFSITANGTTNQGINTTCPNPPTTTQGTATSVGVSASDPDGTVTSASIISAPVTGISLDNFTQAPNVAGTANATLNVANTTAAGTYNVTIRWSNNDSPTPQTADCTVVVTVLAPNQPIAPTCPASLTTTQGTATSTGVSATDPDGTVTSASITSAPVAGITLDSFTPAAGAGGTASATLNVSNTTAVGTYNVTIQYANNDSPTPQTATCTVVVTVNTPPLAAGSVVISQVYGGGGNAGATIKNDFIEIINHTGATVNLTGASVQYSSAAGSSWQVTPLTGPSLVLAPGQYFLIQEAAGTGGTVDLVPDTTGSIAMAAGAGKVALVNNTTALSGSCPSGSGIVDLVGYGATASCFEGSGPTGAPSATVAELRKDNGCTDTDNNNADFVSGAPNPRNSSSPTNNCAVLKGTGSANPFGVQQGGSTTLTVIVTPGSDPTSTGIAVSADLSSIGGAANQPFSGSGNTFTYFATVSNSAPLGNKLLPVSISDAQGRNASTTIALVVQQPHVVISQVYGGGGNSGATYTNDFVELYNPTGQTFDLSDYSLQYASAAGGDGWEFTRTPLGGTIGPGEYYLISLGSGGATGSPLPAANITSDVNISGSAGKLALVNSFDPLAGICPLGDPTIQDFVGYGATADCSETANAPAPSNTTSILRANNGATDSDNNSTDFATGAPNPRRTAPIVEIGPSVFGTDPRNNGFNAPRDASMTITFTEPVDVNGSWYNISCATTGAHNDATVAFTSNFKVYVITPNVNFLAGEQCTVTLFKDQISDQDTDDAGTNSDHLRADYTWSFTVSTGTAPPYPPDVHLTMGNPTGATVDINQPNNYLMEKPEFALSYNRDYGRPNWVSWHLSDEWTGSLTRVDSFRPDPGVPPDWYRVQATDFSGTGFDRGHMTPNADRDKETSIPINQATFLMSNMVAQSPDNNQGPWANLENYLRSLTPANEIYIVSGPFGIGGTGSNGGNTNTIAGGHVTVPSSTWKVALVIPKASGDDISRVMCNSTTIAVSMPNVQGIRNNDWHIYLTTVDAIESQTGYNFYSNLPAGIQNCVESGTNGSGNHPGTEGQSVITSEETPVSITLTAESANANPLTYTIVTGPSHGGLSGTGANRTYTPSLDYFGPDSFTFKVNDGTNDSNVSTVSIAVTNVEDAPVAADDTATTDEDTPATINVLSNDSDVDNDTLTVSAVTQGAHGSVVNNGTDVTYSPAADYNGTDSFSYTVSDGNGGTATANVSVTINAANDTPVAADDSATTDEDTPATIDVLGNDSDVDNDTLTVSAVTQGAHGSVVNNGTDVTYSPAADYNGTDSFSYTVSDGHGGTATANVSVTINAVNDNPVAADDSATTDEDTPATIDVRSNDSDVDNDTLTVSAVTQGAHGSVVNNGTDVTYSPAADYNGTDSFSYTVSDGHGGTATANVSVTINAVNDNPVAVNDAASTNEDNSATIDVVANDTDVDGDARSLASVGTASHGSVSIVSGKAFYSPAANYNGSDSFTYVVSDGHGGQATGNVSVTVNPVNDAPTANSQSVATAYNTPVAITLTGSDVETAPANLIYIVTVSPSHGVLTGTGANRTYTPAPNYSGPDSFKFTVTDTGDGASPPLTSSEATVSIAVDCPQLTALGAASIWLGLKNSDDVGTKFDLLAEVLKNGVVVGSGQLNDVPGGSSGFNNAVQRAINQSLSSSQSLCPGDTLSIRLSVRVAASSGHVSGTARLWFNDSAANSRFTATIGGVTSDYYLRSGFTLVTTAGPGPKSTIDVTVNRNQNGNPWKPFGTWTIGF